MKLIVVLTLLKQALSLVPQDSLLRYDKAMLTELHSTPINVEWELFLKVYQKNYPNKKEWLRRKMLYFLTREYINKHNERFKNGEVTFTAAINSFTDHSLEEARAEKLGFLSGEEKADYNSMDYLGQSVTTSTTNANQTTPATEVELPDSVDWSTCISDPPPVMDQGNCGSCWAFTALAVMETMMAAKGVYVKLSEQQLVDCSAPQKNRGCKGGLMSKAYEFIIQNKGVTSNELYPYEDKDGVCKPNITSVAFITGYKSLFELTPKILMKILATHGPTGVAMDASLTSFLIYNKGMYHDPMCNKTHVNHGVTLVGYGTTDEDEDYWLLKNSWGTSWGEDGYFKIRRDNNNSCGILCMAFYPTMKIEQPYGKEAQNPPQL